MFENLLFQIILLSHDHRITERFALEGTFKSHLVRPHPTVSRDILS